MPWHWSHRSADCDAWYVSDPETPWHLSWKALFPLAQTEVVRGPHRADAVAASGKVIEFQHSSISATEIAEREAFYGDMLWVIDTAPFGRNLEFTNAGAGWEVRWNRPRVSWAAATRPILLDLRDGYVFSTHQQKRMASGLVLAGQIGRVESLVQVWAPSALTAFCLPLRPKPAIVGWHCGRCGRNMAARPEFPMKCSFCNVTADSSKFATIFSWESF